MPRLMMMILLDLKYATRKVTVQPGVKVKDKSQSHNSLFSLGMFK
jgi:hypothetical protein